jgi:DNA-binding NtrC family response regulator
MIPSESETRDKRTKRCTVLFVDDEPQVLAGLKNALRKNPFTILTAGSGEQALELLAENEVDVVVSDERMPSMTGSEFLSIVRRRHPNAIRIILTGQASLEAAIRAINEGEVYRFLAKPCNPVDLATTIQRALQLRNLARESSRLLARTREQDKILRDLEDKYPGISEINKAERGAILLEDVEGLDDLIGQIERENS